MKTKIVFGIALLAAGSLWAADAADKAKDALTKLKASANYSWTTTVKLPGSPFEPGPLKGRAEMNGYAVVSQTFNDNAMDAVFKGTNIAVKVENEWKIADPADQGTAMMAGMLTRSGTAAEEADNLLKKVKALSAEGDLLSGDLTADGAKELMSFGPRDGGAPGPKDARGSVKFWVKDGALTKFESHLNGKISFAPDQDPNDFEIIRTVEISGVGTTKLDAPADAVKKLEKK